MHILFMQPSYEMVNNLKEQKEFDSFIDNYMMTKVDDIHHLTCFMTGLVNKMLHNDNDSFLHTYKEFKEIVEKEKGFLCKRDIDIMDSQFRYVYLYALIKCVQAKLFDENMFGSFSKDRIIELIHE